VTLVSPGTLVFFLSIRFLASYSIKPDKKGYVLYGLSHCSTFPLRID
jgi:hypothetical protein